MRKNEDSGLRVIVRQQTADKAVKSASAMAAKYGAKFAVVEDRDMVNGGGDDYPYAVVTPYAYPYDKR